MLDLEPTTEPPLSSMELAAVNKAIALITGIRPGTQFRINYTCGATFGTLEVAPPIDNGKRKRKYPKGATAAYQVPIVREAGEKIGQIVEVPYDPRFDNAILAGNIGSYWGNHWGSGNVMVERDEEKGCVRIMRLG